MMTEPVAVAPDRFFDFITAPGLAVVFVSVHPLHSFNRSLPQHLGAGATAGEPISFGRMDLPTLLTSGGPLVPYFRRALANCGAPAQLGVVPGYCLFRSGEMLAWDPGLPTLGDLGYIARGALLGAIWSAFTRNLAFVGQALRDAAEEVAAERTAMSFRIAAGAGDPCARARQSSSSSASSTSSSSRAWGSAPAPAQDLFWAYGVLGVSPSADDEEVHRAWRRRRVENHPDRAALDPVEFERRSRASAEINRAREIILEARRGWRPRGRRGAA